MTTGEANRFWSLLLAPSKITLTVVPPLPAVLLSVASVSHSQLQSKHIKLKSLEIHNSQILNCVLNSMIKS